VPEARRKRLPSAGILVYRGKSPDELEVLLVHPGGPLWTKRDLGAWSIPKGEYEPDEDALAAARREFAEELGVEPPDGPYEDLGEVRQKSGKLVHGWAVRGELDTSEITSNTAFVEWPPRSGRTIEIPEVDRAEWLTLEQAREKINPAQITLLERLRDLVAAATR
jgi:predicted NUDIX family NTP pyrophosphohydrolase